MQQRHINRDVYFNELAKTSRDFYIDYLREFTTIKPSCKIAEIGCGEGGNLLPFAEIGCSITGIDLSSDRIEQAKDFFCKAKLEGKFVNINFFDVNPSDYEKYDIILIHDVIEHIHDKSTFIKHLKQFLTKDGILFWGFPAWQMPFGGHQQICNNKFCSLLPFIHLLPKGVYRALLKSFKEKQNCIDELIDIKECQVSIELFEKLIHENGLKIVNKRFWFINPHYKQKFNLKPRRLYSFLSKITYIRNFFTTSCFYITKL